MVNGSSGVVNAMTVDVEDYFQVSAFRHVVPFDSWDGLESRVCRNTERLLSILGDADVRGTFFMLGWVARKYPRLVRAIADAGHELASHGCDHRLVYESTEKEFRNDIRVAKRLIEDAGGQAVTGYRAPSFSIVKESMWALDILIEEGFEYDASIYPIRHDRYGVPGADRHIHDLRRAAGTIRECPSATIRYGPFTLPTAGGGYFRILPYAWTRWGIERLNRVEGQPAIFYLHPWEIDPAQPRLASRSLSSLRHYSNLAGCERRLKRLLREFPFGRLADVLAAAGHQSSAPALASRHSS
jgi:polysaccharide deacetylase family protein (PEP-CTERM system associated)